MANVALKPSYQIVNGVRCPWFKRESFLEAMNYKPTSEDVFIVTYPKCGTTWMQNIVLYIFRKGKELEDYRYFRQMSPFIDPLGLQGINDMPRPGAFKTHLPYNLVPYSPEAKYIFALRNPKDCCVSLYYHTKSSKDFKYSEGIFDDFYEVFMSGEVEYNDYFDHLMSWYPHRNSKEIFYTTYEDMKLDTRSVVLKLATFLGREYIEAIEKDNSVMNNILKFSGFEYMKKQLTQEYDPVPVKDNKVKEINEIEPNKWSNSTMRRSHFSKDHFRKGVVGDWKKHFTEEQSVRLNKKFCDRFEGTEIYEKYKAFM